MTRGTSEMSTQEKPDKSTNPPKPTKPLGHKAYGSIGHLPGSRLGPGDKHVPEGQARICTETRRDMHDAVVIQTKFDGSCCAVAKLADWSIVPLNRAGYPAITSPYAQHHYFHDWVMAREGMFSRLLKPGERIVGEWMLQAHSTRYFITNADDLFVAFDIMSGHERLPYWELKQRIGDKIPTPQTLTIGSGQSVRPEEAYQILQERDRLNSIALATGELPEGLIYRVHRKGNVDFLAKWVRPGKVDGKYLPELNNDVNEPAWNFDPKNLA